MKDRFVDQFMLITKMKAKESVAVIVIVANQLIRNTLFKFIEKKQATMF